MTIVGEAAAMKARAAKRANLFVSTAMAGVLLGAGAGASAVQAQALDACGPADADGAVTCTPAGNPYPDGIHYVSPPANPGDDVDDPATPVLDLTVVIEPEAVVRPAGPTAAGPAVLLEGRNDGSVALYAEYDTAVVTDGDYQPGVVVAAESGDVGLYAPDVVLTYGDGSAAITAETTGGGDIWAASYDVATLGHFSNGVTANARGGGDVEVAAYGDITTLGYYSTAIDARTTAGSVRVETEGDIFVGGDRADGVRAEGDSVSVVLGGAVETRGSFGAAVYAHARDGSATVTIGDSVTVEGTGTSVLVVASGDAAITGQSVSTQGFFSTGASAISEGDGDAVVDLATVSTAGDRSAGAVASATTGSAHAEADNVFTEGEGSSGLVSRSDYGDATVVSTGVISTAGEGATGALAVAGRLATLSVNDVLTTGDNSAAVWGLGEAVTATITGTVATTGASNSPYEDAPNATVYLAATVRPANAGDPPVNSGVAAVANSGTIFAEGENTDGLRLRGDTGVVVSGPGAVETRGYGAAGIVSTSGGSTSIIQDSVTTAGDLSSGVVATVARDSFIDIGIVETSGDIADGIVVQGTGDVEVVADEVSTTGDSSFGIHVLTSGSATIRGGTVTTSGEAADAIVAETDGNIRIVHDHVTTEGLDANGVFAASQAGGIEIALGSVSSRQGSRGVVALTYGAEAMAIDVGSGVAAGDGSRIVEATAHSDGDIEVAAGALQGDGAGSVGILAQAAGAGEVSVNADEVNQSGPNAVGVRLRALGGGDAFASIGSVVISGENSSGVLARSAYGDVDLTVGSVTASGHAVYGAQAAAAEGTASVTAGSGDFAGDGARGFTAVGANARVTVTGSVTSEGERSAAIGASGTQTAEVVLDGDVETRGPLAGGVLIYGDGGATFTGSGSVVTSGEFSQAVSVNAARGDAVVDFGTIVTTGAIAAGIRVLADGAADVKIDSARTYGLYSVAVEAQSGDGGDAVTIEVADAYAQRSTAIFAAGRGTAQVTVGNVGVGRTFGSAGIRILAGDAFATVEGVIDTEAYGGELFRASGVRLESVGGATEGAGLTGNVVNNGQIITRGNRASGVYADVAGDVVISGPGSIVTHGVASEGVFAQSGRGGRVSVSQERIQTGGELASGLRIVTDGGVEIDVGSVETAGGGARGMDIRVRGAVDVRAGSVRTLGVLARGVDIRTFDDVTLDIGSVETAGEDAVGVSVQTTGDVTAAIDSLSTEGDNAIGLRAQGARNIAITLADGSTSGVGAHLVTAGSGGGDVAVASTGTLSVSGDGSTLLRAESLYSTTVAVRHGQVSGEGSRGVLAIGATGATVTVTGELEVASSGDDAIAVAAESGAGAATVTVAAGGAVTAPRTAVAMSSATGSTLVNAGRIDAGGAVALRASGGAATVTNTGSLTGALVLTAAADSVTSSGSLDLAAGTDFGAGDDRLTNSGLLVLSGDLLFGAGADAFTNTGTLRLSGGSAPAAAAMRLAALAAAAPQTRTLSGLETFTNAGLIDLRSGVAGDGLSASGAFVGGTGSVLALDVGAETADQLTIGGAATGVTRIVLEPLDGADAVLQPGIALVSAGTGTTAGAFVLDEDSRRSGFIERDLVFDAASGGFTLVGAPNPAAYRLMKLGETAQTLWLSSADAVASHLATARNAGDQAPGVWAQVSGGGISRDQVTSFDNSGFVQSVDLGYRQDLWGAQFGYDFGGEGLRAGVTGGYETSKVDFAAGDRAEFEAANFGLYVDARAGALFASGLFKIDRSRVRTTLVSVGASDRFDADTYGGRFEAGYRFGGSAFYAEPVVSVTYVRSRFDDTGAFGASVAFDPDIESRAMTAVRVGGRRALANGKALDLHLSLGAAKSLGSEGGIAFTTGADTVTFADERADGYGVAKAGVAMTSGRMTAFFEADGRSGGAYKGGAGRIGLKVSF